jgi:hypothetical protein
MVLGGDDGALPSYGKDFCEQYLAGLKAYGFHPKGKLLEYEAMEFLSCVPVPVQEYTYNGANPLGVKLNHVFVLKPFKFWDKVALAVSSVHDPELHWRSVIAAMAQSWAPLPVFGEVAKSIDFTDSKRELGDVLRFRVKSQFTHYATAETRRWFYDRYGIGETQYPALKAYLLDPTANRSFEPIFRAAKLVDLDPTGESLREVPFRTPFEEDKATWAEYEEEFQRLLTSVTPSVDP